MNKFTLILVSFLFSLTSYSQITEGFENTTGPATLPDWTLDSGLWKVFDNGIGTGNSWTINALSNSGANAAYINRDQNGAAGATSEDYLATPLVTVPLNGQLRFFSRTFTNNNQGTTYQVKVAPQGSNQTDPASYTILLQQYTEDQLTFDNVTSTQNAFNVYTEQVINFPASLFNTQVYIAFVKVFTQPTTAIGGDRWLLDDVNLVEQCLDPTALLASPQATTATLSWTGAGTSFEIENVIQTAAPTGVPNATSTTNSVALSGLTANTQYCFYVRAICSAGNSSNWVGPICYTTSTLPPACGGNYVDSGGTTGNYPNNADSIVTICPENTGDVVTVTFTSFNTEATFDGMYVFNGNSINAPQIASNNPAGNVPGGLAGSYWGTTIPGPFTSSSSDGCLTFRFRSDGIVNNPGWIANITCGLPPTCPNPTGLSSNTVTSNSANISWTSNSTATNYNIYVVPAGGNPPNATTTGYLTSNIHTNSPLTGLTPDTCYDVYVRDECGTSDFSLWVGPTSFCTQIAPPVCGGTFTDTGGVANNYSDNEDSIVTICPTVLGEVVTVQFTSFNTEANWDGLYIFNGNSINATQIASTNGPGNVPGGLAGSFWGTASPGIITSSSPNGCLTFRFRSDSSFNNPGWVANVICGPPPTCPNPNGLSSNTITSNSANISWTSNSTATTYNIYVVPAGGNPPNASTTGYLSSNTNTNAPLADLTPDTCYDVYVRDECGTSDFSLWIGPTSFCTQIEPPVCGGTFTDPGGSSNNYADSTDSTVTICPQNANEVVVVTFTSFNTEANWDGLLIYDGNAINSPQIPSLNGTGFGFFNNVTGAYWGNLDANLPGPFISSSPDGCLTFRFVSDGSVNNPGWIANVTCIPAPTCRKPSNLSATNIALTTADLTWNQTPNPDNSLATAWEILILSAGSPAPTNSTSGTPTTSTTYNAINLTSATCYDYYVRAVCSDTDTSFWAGPFTFCTLIENDECINTTEVLTNPDQSCTNFGNGSLIGATASNNANTCGGTDDDDVWFSFVATAANHTIDLYNITGSTNDLFHVLYSGTCGNLTQIYCSDPNQSLANNLVIGQTYYVRVYSWTATPNQTSVFNICIGTIPPPISANTTQYTSLQLVEDVLLNTTCAQVSNITTSTGSNFGSSNGIGYFNQNGSTFPFSEGVVLATRSIDYTPGPNNIFPPFVTGWPGDNDLFNYVQNSGIDPFLDDYNDASVLEFDFVPLIDTISFDFIFASEEYGTFQCTFSDAFAFFLTNNTTGVTTNLAVVPNTNQPISVLTIRDNQFNPGCASVNPEYFADYYLQDQPGGLSPLDDPINFNGWTVPMTATSQVIPGQQYHIKLVVADRNDSALDSAVFLKGGSFNIGNIELGGDFLESNGTALCAGASQVISADLDPNSYDFSWTLNDEVIPNENGPSITVSQEGVYALTATYIGTTCGSSDSVTVEIYDPIQTSPASNLTDCNPTGFGTFDLTTNDSNVLGALNSSEYTVSYYLTADDATSGTSALTSPYSNVDQYLQTVYVRLENNLSHCFGTTQFDLIVQDLTPEFTITPDFTICEGNNATITVTPINYNNADVTYTWTLNGDTLNETSNEITINTGGLYEVTVNNQGCTATGQTTVTAIPTPIPDNLEPVTACETYTLEPLTIGNYYTATGGPNGSGQMLNTGDVITTSTTLYIYASSNDATNCSNENTFEITINNVVQPTFNALAPICQNDPSIQLSLSSLEGFTGTWSPSSTIDTSTPGEFTYTFTPDSQFCASTYDLVVTITEQVVPTFNFVTTLCQNSTSTTLPTISTNNIEGTWNVASIDTSTIGDTTYTFTPNAGVCATSVDVVVTITSQVTPTFTPITLCQFSTDNSFPNSIEGIVGTWSVAAIDTSTFGTFQYTFTPDLNVSPCAVNGTLDVTIEQLLTPEFIINTSICQNSTPIVLPTSSNNSSPITGQWSLGGNNVATIDTSTSGEFTYTFTPDSQFCASVFDLVVTINIEETPTFNFTTTLCQNSTSTTLPTISTNNIEGTWNVSSIDTSTIGETTYTFTPNAGFCATSVDVVVTITSQVTPTFTPVTLCQFSTDNAFPTSSIPGTWSVAAIDTSTFGTFQYTFTPDLNVSPCAVNGTLDVTIIEKVQSTFNALPAICQGDAVPGYPSVSNEGNSGSWVGSFDPNTPGTQTITFIPDAGTCAFDGSLSLTVNAPVVSTFNSLANVCQGDTAPTLPTNSLQGFTGTWSGTFDTSLTGTQTITFIPDAGQCASNGTLSLTVNAPTQATFNQVAPVCQFDNAPVVTTTSLEGFSGSWSPINTSTFGPQTITFTPNAGQCATGTTMTITVIEKPVIDTVEDIPGCDSATLPTLTIGGNYYTGTGGTGTQLAEGSVIDSSQTVYVYANNSGCISEDSFNVIITDSPVFTIAGNCEGGTYVLTATLSSTETGTVSYAWTNSSGQTVGTDSSTLDVTVAGNYTCTVTIDNNCSSEETFAANEIGCMIPNGISPNGDGKNDEFDLSGFNVKQLTIYNRYGSKVYSKKAYTNQWNGKSDNGSELPDGTYYYVIERDGVQTKTGWVYINREIK